MGESKTSTPREPHDGPDLEMPAVRARMSMVVRGAAIPVLLDLPAHPGPSRSRAPAEGSRSQSADRRNRVVEPDHCNAGLSRRQIGKLKTAGQMIDIININLDSIPPEHIPAAIAYLSARLMGAKQPQPATPEPDRLLRVKEVAARLNLAPSYVYELVRSRQLPSIRAGKYVRIKASAVERYMAQHEHGAPLDNRVGTMSTSSHVAGRGKGVTAAAGINAGRTGRPLGHGQDVHIEVGARYGGNPKSESVTPQAIGPTAPQTGQGE
jgi:excisionase family DNA binding protein